MLKVLIDTTFILPTLGIDTGEEVSKGLRKLASSEAEIYYSNFSILEALWVAARFSRTANFCAEIFRQGLRSILESGKYIKVEEDSEIFNVALSLYMMGHRDMIDNILYANSIHFKLKLLTLDMQLKEFIQEKELEDTLIHPSKISLS